ncbi:MAG: Na+/H+ antiporter subunit E [Thermodesulfobacteriota bacterium]|jgi:multicomponent Na+:H+ antiporter subunit E
MLLLNVLLALAWVALTGQFTPTNLMVGFALGSLLIWLTQGPAGSVQYFVKVRRVCTFAAFFVWELIKANLRVTYEVLTPRHYMRPGVIAIPLDVRSDAEITLLANLITLTPGTLSLDVSADRRVLYVHTMYVDDVDQFRRELKAGFERRVQEVLR